MHLQEQWSVRIISFCTAFMMVVNAVIQTIGRDLKLYFRAVNSPLLSLISVFWFQMLQVQVVLITSIFFLFFVH
jgi:hypothetical protein